MRPQAEQCLGVHAFCFLSNINSNHYSGNLYYYFFITMCERKFVSVLSRVFFVSVVEQPLEVSVSNTESALGDYNQRHLASALRTVVDSDHSLQ